MRIEEIIDKHGLELETTQTITSREELFDELEHIRDQGIAFNFEEHKKESLPWQHRFESQTVVFSAR